MNGDKWEKTYMIIGDRRKVALLNIYPISGIASSSTISSRSTWRLANWDLAETCWRALKERTFQNKLNFLLILNKQPFYPV